MTRALVSDFQNPPTIVQYFFMDLSYFGSDLEQSIKWRESVMLWMLYGSFRNTSCGQASRSNFRTFPRKKKKSYLAREFWSSSSHSTWPIPANSSRKMNKKIYLPTTTYHYIIKQNFCCHCIVDIKLQSQILKNDDIPTVKYVRFIKCSSISSELNNNWDDISMCYKVQFLTTNNEDKYSNNASTFYY